MSDQPEHEHVVVRPQTAQGHGQQGHQEQGQEQEQG